MALSGLDIYKLLPKTNCRACGFPTCLAFAMQLAKKAVNLDKCPYVSAEAKRAIEASSQPPIKIVTIGTGENKLEIGNETVLFRHEEKFFNPCGIGFIIDDNEGVNIRRKLEKINRLKFERVGQKLEVNLICLRQQGNPRQFTEALNLVLKDTPLALVLMVKDIQTLQDALQISKERRPLIYPVANQDYLSIAKIAKYFKFPLVAYAYNLDELSNLVQELDRAGVADIVLDTGRKSVADKIWDLTQIRRLALKKNYRSLGYPVLAVAENDDPYTEAQEAATYITKYAGIVLLKGIDSWEALSLLTLRQNIYSDPQKPLQVEPKVYPIGQVTSDSPVLVTTNFSLTYYTVLGEVEASKVPSYIVSVDTEGMSVLTAWAAEKFTPESISNCLNKFKISEMVSHNTLIIPGYVAVMSGELEEQSGWKVAVGPKEAAGIPSFLKNLQ
ncbi:MAG: acetyl-CoA decarbonylase/synthase complex subunit gamma [Candidatus Omnitrophica bacterium]|nr:acetyl-CoA decarbonylase/synthase complex subunit gamma [Candidatus Omnitrophota bacterium]